jgi:DNA invertase Pin-like site-specific DNA recombinase
LDPVKEDVSGAVPLIDRSKGKGILDMLNAHGADGVVWYTVDRFFRDDLEARIQCRQWLRAGIELHFVDTGQVKSESDIVFLLRTWQASDEREKIKERTMRGKHTKAAQRWVGCTCVPFGYQRVGQGKQVQLEVYEPEAKIVRRIFAMYIQDRASLLDITRILTREGIPTGRSSRKPAVQGWYKSSISAILRNCSYIGEFRFGETVAHLPELALIDLATFNQARIVKQENTCRSKRNTRYDYLMRNQLTCVCGLKMQSTHSHWGERRHSYYRCNRRGYGAAEMNCSEKKLSATKFDSLVWNWLIKLFNDPERMERGYVEYLELKQLELAPKTDRLECLDAMIAESKEESARLTSSIRRSRSDTARASLEAELDSVSETLQGYQHERDALAMELEALKANGIPAEDFMTWATEIRDGLIAGDVDFGTKRKVVEKLDVTAKVEYKEGRRGVRITCHLQYATDWQSFEYPSSSVPRCPTAPRQ